MVGRRGKRKNINKNHYNLIQEWISENPDFQEIEEKQKANLIMV